MSVLEELVNQYCPDGVEYKRFDEVCTLHARIGWQRLTKTEHQKTGNYMLITGTDFTASHEVNYDSCVYVSKERYEQDKKLQLKNGDILVTKDGTLGKIAQVNGLPMPATLNGGVFVVRPVDDRLNSRFILQYLLSNHFMNVVHSRKTGSTISHLTQGLFSQIEIPVPPLPVQEEIVRILDGLSGLEHELENGLEHELVLRKKQYVFYRENILLSAKDIEWIPIGELGDIIRGKRFVHKDDTAEGVPAIHYGELYTYYGIAADKTKTHIRPELQSKMRYAHTGDVVIVGAGENKTDIGVGVAWMGDEDIAIHDACFILTNHNQNPKYISYCLRTEDYHKKLFPFVSEGKICSFLKDGLAQVSIPIPKDRKEQDRIVELLDTFDSLTTAFSDALPTEINRRRQQYEFYRDKLLSFKDIAGE